MLPDGTLFKVGLRVTTGEAVAGTVVTSVTLVRVAMTPGTAMAAILGDVLGAALPDGDALGLALPDGDALGLALPEGDMVVTVSFPETPTSVEFSLEVVFPKELERVSFAEDAARVELAVGSVLLEGTSCAVVKADNKVNNNAIFIVAVVFGAETRHDDYLLLSSFRVL